METLFGKKSPAQVDVVRKGVSILGTASTHTRLVEVSRKYGATIGSMVGLLIEHVLSNEEVLGRAIAGKFVEDRRGGNRKKLAGDPDAIQEGVIRMLIQIAERETQEKESKPEQSNELREVLIRILNPGDYLVSDIRVALKALDVTEKGAFSISTEEALRDAYRERSRILNAWKEHIAICLIEIQEIEKHKEGRAARAKIRTATAQLLKFKKLIRAEVRLLSTPNNYEEARIFMEKREVRET